MFDFFKRYEAHHDVEPRPEDLTFSAESFLRTHRLVEMEKELVGGGVLVGDLAVDQKNALDRRIEQKLLEQLVKLWKSEGDTRSANDQFTEAMKLIHRWMVNERPRHDVSEGVQTESEADLYYEKLLRETAKPAPEPPRGRLPDVVSESFPSFPENTLEVEGVEESGEQEVA